MLPLRRERHASGRIGVRAAGMPMLGGALSEYLDNVLSPADAGRILGPYLHTVGCSDRGVARASKALFHPQRSRSAACNRRLLISRVTGPVIPVLPI
jgi:hypothetical protein